MGAVRQIVSFKTKCRTCLFATNCRIYSFSVKIKLDAQCKESEILQGICIEAKALAYTGHGYLRDTDGAGVGAGQSIPLWGIDFPAWGAGGPVGEGGGALQQAQAHPPLLPNGVKGAL